MENFFNRAISNGEFSRFTAPGRAQRRGLRKSRRSAIFAMFHAEVLENRLFLTAAPATLYSFSGGSDGGVPTGITMDSDGNLYGTTQNGGANGNGTVWELAKGSSSVTTLGSFTGGSDGTNSSGITIDGSGNLYGTSNSGGNDNQGDVWELAEGSSSITTLYTFAGQTYTPASVGADPSGITVDSNGNLYGTCQEGGPTASYGTVWKLAKGSATPIVLYNFTANVDGNAPPAIAMDSDGNVYGTTVNAGINGDGTVWELPKGGSTVITLYSFPANNSAYPSGIALDSAGNLYGATNGSGVNGGYGTVWELPRGSGALTTIYSFADGEGGGGGVYPFGVTLDGAGYLYGTAKLGGADDYGAIFELRVTGAIPGPYLAFAQQPASVSTTGALGTITVDVEDSSGHLLSSDHSDVTIAIGSSPAAATLAGTATVAAVNGVATFSNLSIATLGSNYLLTATDGDDIPATSTFFTIAQPTTNQLAFDQEPVGAATTATLAPIIVNVEDSSGNVLTNDDSIVSLVIASGPSGATLEGAINVAAIGGVATFSNLSITTPGGNYTLTATDGGDTPATSTSFAVSVPTGYKLAFVQQPGSTTTTGTLAPITVDVENASGALLNTDNSNVTLAITGGPAGATLGGAATVAAVNGVANFTDLSIATPGNNYTLTATDGSDTPTTSTSFTISSPTANQLAFVEQPGSTTTTGTLGPVTVDVEDSGGNPLTTDDSNVTLAITGGPGGASLGGTTTVTAVNGVATFTDLSIATAGGYTLTATDGGDTPTTSTSFNISPPALNQSELTASDGAMGDAFGSAVSISGNTLVVGAPNATVAGNTYQGAVYVFTGSGSSWTQIAKLTASDGTNSDSSNFGASVSISGNTVVVGASGAAYVFAEPGSGWTDMTETAILTPSDGNDGGDEFGCSVAVAGNTVVVGADSANDGGNDLYIVPGAAYVYTEPGSGWANATQNAKLIPAPGSSLTDSGIQFGHSVAIGANKVVVGAPGLGDADSSGLGAAYVFTEPGSGWKDMDQGVEFSDDQPLDGFGESVSISGGGNMVVVGANDLVEPTYTFAAYVYTDDGRFWTGPAQLTASDGGNGFGESVSIGGDTVVVGASGAAYVFTKPGSGWTDMTEAANLIASNTAGGDAFGSPVFFSDNMVIVGADGANNNQGAAYVFVVADGSGTGSSLTPSLAGAVFPPAVVAGGKFDARLPVTVTNTGANFKGKVTVNLYADTTSGLDGNQIPLLSGTKGFSLKAGKHATVAMILKSLPASLPDGTYYILAQVVDPSGMANVTATAQTVTVAAAVITPTVSVGNVTPATIAMGKFGSISITVTNDGNVPASGVDTSLSPSEDGATPVAGVILESAASSVRILPNKSKTFRLHFKVTSALAAGSYFPYVSATLGGVSITMVGSARFTVG